MKTTKTLGKKNCSVGATCKGTCISKAKDCLVTLSPKNKKRISDAVRKLKAGSSDKNRRATIEKAEKEFIKKGGSVPAAAKLLTTLLGNKGPEYKGSGPENLKAVINDFYKLTGRTQRLKLLQRVTDVAKQTAEMRALKSVIKLMQFKLVKKFSMSCFTSRLNQLLKLNNQKKILLTVEKPENLST